ncbi:MAG: glycosyltransferase family 8 protein [Alphaproteobacteria bacterium]|nr:glycosyltransferase family 8 protein [Alphaproteobacteria bacterium]
MNTKNIFLLLLCVPNICSMDISYVLDDNYVEPVAVSINSLIRHSKPEDKLNLHIVDLGISFQNKEKFYKFESSGNRQVSIDFTKFNLSKFDDLKPSSCGKSVYTRFILQDIFPNLDRLIFIDGDTVITDSLSELWNFNIKGKYWAGSYHSWGPSRCSAVMLLDLKSFRANKLGSSLIDATKRRQKISYCNEEYALNGLGRSKVGILPFRYNMHVAFTEYTRTKNINGNQKMINDEIPNTVIWHYSSTYKPWKIERHIFEMVCPVGPYDLWHEEFNALPGCWHEKDIEYFAIDYESEDYDEC